MADEEKKDEKAEQGKTIDDKELKEVAGAGPLYKDSNRGNRPVS
jgi:hypothetical protein